MHLDVGGAPVVDQVRVTDAGRLSLSVIDAFGGAAAAGAAGATASGVAITGVTGLAAASTGTSIGALSGAAATNATLAWFGGGALAAGGGGVAAGTMVLTGVAAAPAMLVGGLFLHQKGRQAIAKADRYGADVDSARAKHREAQVVLRAAADLASGVRQLIDQLVPAVTRGTGWLEVVVESESDWTALRLETQERIRSLCVLAVALSDLVHTPLVDEDGALTGAIQEAYVQGQVVAGGIAT